MGITGTGYIRRSEFLVLADVSATATPEWELIGDKVESLNLALNPNVETITDITGVTSTTLDRYQVQTDVTPMRARRESKLAAILYDIVKSEKTLSDVERKFLVVNVFDAGAGSTYAAWQQTGVIAVQTYGGDTKGLDMPFNIHWVGAKAHGTFDPTTKAFTAGEAAEYLATYSIAGTAEARIAGAVVVVAGQTLLSDANGMAGILLPAGSHPYTITATGYTVSTGTTVITSSAVYKAITLTI